MKRTFILVYTCILLIIISGCGGLSKHKAISVDALFSDNHYEMKFLSYYASGDLFLNDGMYFETKVPLEEIMESIREHIEITDAGQQDVKPRVLTENSVRLFTDCVLISIDNGDSTFDHFSLQLARLESKYGTRYYLTPMNASVKFEDSTSEVTVLLPIHLISDPRITDPRITETSSPIVYEGAEYEVSSTLSAFYEFYTESGWYEIEKRENSMIIQSYLKDPIKDANNPEELDIPFPIELTFTEHAGQLFVGINSSEVDSDADM